MRYMNALERIDYIMTHQQNNDGSWSEAEPEKASWEKDDESFDLKNFFFIPSMAKINISSPFRDRTGNTTGERFKYKSKD